MAGAVRSALPYRHRGDDNPAPVLFFRLCFFGGVSFGGALFDLAACFAWILFAVGFAFEAIWRQVKLCGQAGVVGNLIVVTGGHTLDGVELCGGNCATSFKLLTDRLGESLVVVNPLATTGSRSPFLDSG